MSLAERIEELVAKHGSLRTLLWVQWCGHDWRYAWRCASIYWFKGAKP